VVSWTWRNALSKTERQMYHGRCEAAGVKLSVDRRLSRHFVEVSDLDEPPLSIECRT
jgi:hypothetical protein